MKTIKCYKLGVTGVALRYILLSDTVIWCLQISKDIYLLIFPLSC